MVGVRLQNQIIIYFIPPGSQFAGRIPLILQCNFGLQFAAAPTPAFESASWEEQEPPLPKEPIKRSDDDTNWSSFDSSVNPSDEKIAAEADPWAQAEIKEEIHTARAVDVQVQLQEGSRGGWPQRRPPRLERPKIEPENQEVDNIVQSMRNILFNL